MKRYITCIVVHSTATFDPRQSQHYGDFHYVVERNGEIKKIHPENSVIKHLPAVDNEAIQEEALFNKLVVLSVKYPGVKITGHNELDSSANCPGFSVKDWLKQYDPGISLNA